jgi:hypothetical protein
MRKPVGPSGIEGDATVNSDNRLQELQAEGLNVAETAKRLGATRQAVSMRIADGG